MRNTSPFAVPLLVCVDMQQEHLMPGRRHEMVDSEVVLANCRRIVEHWRSRSWPVAHLKRVAKAAWFNPVSSLTDWLPDWRPLPGEIAFEHPLPSAFSSSRFSEYFAHVGPTDALLIGFSLEEAILSTVVEGFHRGHSLRVCADAVACGHGPQCDRSSFRGVLLHLVRNYAVVEPFEQQVAIQGRV
jgi:nicotinamidase-related amidase